MKTNANIVYFKKDVAMLMFGIAIYMFIRSLSLLLEMMIGSNLVTTIIFPANLFLLFVYLGISLVQSIKMMCTSCFHKKEKKEIDIYGVIRYSLSLYFALFTGGFRIIKNEINRFDHGIA